MKKVIEIEDEILGNLISNFKAKTLKGQQHKSFSLIEITGAIKVAFHRGVAYGKQIKHTRASQ